MNAERLVGGVALTLALLTLMASPVCAGDSLKLKEAHKHALKCTNQDGDSWCDMMAPGSISVKAKVFTDGSANPTNYNADTYVVLSVGDFYWEGYLGDDPKYVSGGSRATFSLTHEVWNDKTGESKVVTHGKISLGISSKGLTVSVSTKTGDVLVPYDDLGASSVIAPYHDDDPDGSFTDLITASISVGDQSTSADVAIAGTVKHKTAVKNGEPWDLVSIKLQGVPVVAP